MADMAKNFREKVKRLKNCASNVLARPAAEVKEIADTAVMEI